MAGTSNEDLRVVTVSWSGSPTPEGRAANLLAVFPTAVYWQSLPDDPRAPDDSIWTHLYVSRTAVDAPNLRALLLLIAGDDTADVIIGPSNWDWLIHPYDGGADVIAPDPAGRELVRSRHAGWLPDNPMGL